MESCGIFSGAPLKYLFMLTIQTPCPDDPNKDADLPLALMAASVHLRELSDFLHYP
jgi:hypothetical protein